MSNIEKNKILVIDHEETNIEILESLLAGDYTILKTKSGLAAIEMAKTYEPDLILLDNNMPDINSFDALKRLKSEHLTKNIPVVFISDYSDIDDEVNALALEASDILRRPFRPKVIKSRVNNQMQIINQIKKHTKLQKDLENALTEAESANKAKSAFLAKMSHEIRTPLNAVLGISEIQLQNENLPDETKEAFTRIFNSGDLLLSIINDILDMSRIESGKLEITTARYDIFNMINDTVLLNMILYKNKPIKFIINVNEDIPSELIGDEIRIKQILNNLLTNAFKYTDKGEIELYVNAEFALDFSADRSGVVVTLIFSVRDSGQGMTEAQIDKLYEEYSRFNLDVNKNKEGIGLGMGITRNLVNMMNGRLNVKSEIGKGSVFTVKLPQKNASAPPLGREAVDKLRQFKVNFNSKMKKTHIRNDSMPFGKVLVVDDMEMNIYVVQGMLSLYGLNIDTAASGHESIEKAKNNKYDIIFMDQMMPVMDGIEAAREIRKLGSYYEAIPIVAMTANAVSGMKEMFLANGFNAFISKPIVIKELDEILKGCIPEDKIPQTNKLDITMQESNEMDTMYDNFLKEVKKISEINTEAGLNQLLKNKTTYYNTLEIFQKKVEAEAKSMTVSLEDHDLKNFAISVHAMKTMLAIIGAEDLSKEAYEMEMAAKALNRVICVRNYPDFKEKLLSVYHKLKNIFINFENEIIDSKNQEEDKELKRILLVDDTVMLLYVIKEKFARYGLNVDTAENGFEAIEKVKEKEYDLIFMDHMMPELDGIEAAARIRQMGTQYEKIPIIALSSNKEEGAREMFLASGLDGFLAKPIASPELEAILKEWLDIDTDAKQG